MTARAALRALFSGGLVALAVACGGGGGGDAAGGLEAPRWPGLAGVGRSNDWHLATEEFPTIDAYVDRIADAGLTLVGIEYSPVFQPAARPCRDKFNSVGADGTFPAEFQALLGAARRRGVSLLVNVANMNRCALRELNPDSWMENATQEIIAAAGGRWDDLLISPVCEPHDNDPAKSRRWFDLSEGMLRAAGATQIVAPAGWCDPRHALCDHHPQSDEQMHRWLRTGNPRLLVNTDGTGTFELGPERAYVAAQIALAHGTPFHVYPWRFRGPLGPIIDAVGRALAEAGA